MQPDFQKLPDIIEHSAKLYSTNKAIIENNDTHITYQQLENLSQEFYNLFQQFTYTNQSRIVFYCKKSTDCIAAFIGASKANLIYIPVSLLNPYERLLQIIELADTEFMVFDSTATESINTFKIHHPIIQEIRYNSLHIIQITPQVTIPEIDKNLAYILFTSGSTGMPKGVSINHSAAICFIEWCAKTFQINESNSVISIAPFNFDLSIFDIYVTFYSGATLYLCEDDLIKNPLLIAQYMDREKINTIYATPTFYNTFMQFGKLNKYDFSAVKTCLFAGEVFHASGIEQLQKIFYHAQLFNLYGPTETNVCTYFPIPIGSNENTPSYYPIGKACDYATCIIVDENLQIIDDKNKSGELLVAGTSLFSQYWSNELKTIEAFKIINGVKYYRTGDIVYYNDEMDLVYTHRRDDMIKKNGYRIELNEVDAGILNHPKIIQASTIFLSERNELIGFYQTEDQVIIEAFLLKLFCANYLPNYMIPDKFVYLDSFPKTVSGKTDKTTLKNNYEARIK